jgi:VanZ family protein
MSLIRNYWKTILVTLIILVLTFGRFSGLEDIPKVTFCDKIVHFLMYLTLTFVVMYDHHQDVKNKNNRLVFFLLCLITPFILGIVTEILQPVFMKERFTDVYDSLSNTIGILAGWGIFTVFKKMF